MKADVLGGTECSAVMSIKPVFKPKELRTVLVAMFKIFFKYFTFSIVNTRERVELTCAWHSTPRLCRHQTLSSSRRMD